MTPQQKAQAIADGIARARSFRSAGHWNASDRELAMGWYAAREKLDKATTVELVFLASVSCELNAQVLVSRDVKGAWSA